ncbi:MAG: hypothetical protein GTO74_03975, partial [Hydrogenophaga sp.]|nr:hypothetical protein [Hydrogenophaga sp.]NIM69682.1 hypothetical protein [Xanthomonadales bacterium]NIO14810.1 hypothetical protein [Xanthomonadales bacterium]NIO50763.1 hypothetical protein [Hydrogenophaga sp.]NIO88994.1 hypothetical protein [Hydrogenophaga sp.]
GARDGAFFSAYILCRNTLGFLFALTFCRPAAMVFSALTPGEYLAQTYLTAIS